MMTKTQGFLDPFTEIKLNQYCTVILSQAGADFLNKLNAQCNETRWIYSELFQFRTDYKQGEEYSSQLWSVMEKFGQAVSLGVAAPFEGCKLKIKNWK